MTKEIFLQEVDNAIDELIDMGFLHVEEYEEMPDVACPNWEEFE